MKKNVVIIVLVCITLCLGVYLICDKILDKQNNIDENKQESENLPTEEKQEIQNYNYTEISNELNKHLSEFVAYRYDNRNGVDLLSIGDIRLELINFLLMKSNVTQTYNDGVVQSFPYVSYETYKSKYYEVYGGNYSLDTDLSSANPRVAHHDYVGENNIAWNGTWGVSGYKYSLTAQNITYDSENNLYVLSGLFEVKNAESVYDHSGTFVIKYTKANNIKTLKSIILN